MDALNVGAMPVVQTERLVGMLTDRDIVVRATAAGLNPRSATVAEVMTTEPRSVGVYASVLEAVRMIEDQQLRRVPAVDPAGAVAGMVSLGDLAAAGTPEAADALETISTPAEPDR
jgi:CBS domain-containing protein